MAIKTSTFGGVTLTGSAAKAFKKQFIDHPVTENKLAQAALDRGVSRLKEYEEKGYITIQIKDNKSNY